MSTNHHLLINTTAGTLLACIGISDLEKSAVLAAVGASTSFVVSLMLRFLSRKLQQWLSRYKQ